MSVFRSIDNSCHLFSSEYFFAIYDKFPVSPGHILIISHQLKTDFFSLSVDEKNDLSKMIMESKKLLDQNFSPEGYNIGMNCGEVAGQTVMHFHCHIIPRYSGDMSNPRGGVRHCIEGKGYY